MAGIRHLIDTEAHKALFEALRAEFESGLALAMQSAFLPGMVMPFSGSFGGSDGKRPINPHTGLANEGFALCDGGTYQASKTSPLITTPNLQNRFVVGAGQTYSTGAIGGGEGHTHTVRVAPHTLTVGEIAAHKHTVERWGYWTGGGGEVLFTPDIISNAYNIKQPDRISALGIGNTGGSQAHTHGASSDAASSLPPYYALAYIMKL